jgi:antitoxin (DNA-binding transcriptional repressor) of toxin-antitoxin stability system
MSHIMKSATVRDLRYHFSEIEARLQKGEEIEIRKRKRVIARLVPIRPKLERYPDFEARSREIFGDKIVDQTGAELLAWERDRY